MANKQRGGRPRGAGERSKLHAKYNLEKEPLQTGKTFSPISLRTRAAMGIGQWAARRHMAGWVVALLIALLVLMGGTVIGFLIRFFARYYGVEPGA